MTILLFIWLSLNLLRREFCGLFYNDLLENLEILSFVNKFIYQN